MLKCFIARILPISLLNERFNHFNTNVRVVVLNPVSKNIIRHMCTVIIIVFPVPLGTKVLIFLFRDSPLPYLSLFLFGRISQKDLLRLEQVLSSFPPTDAPPAKSTRSYLHKPPKGWIGRIESSQKAKGNLTKAVQIFCNDVEFVWSSHCWYTMNKQIPIKYLPHNVQLNYAILNSLLTDFGLT